MLGKWSKEKPKNKHRVIEMAQRIKVLATMPDDQVQSSGSTWLKKD